MSSIVACLVDRDNSPDAEHDTEPREHGCNYVSVQYQAPLPVGLWVWLFFVGGPEVQEGLQAAWRELLDPAKAR